MNKITPAFWFPEKAEEAAKFYASIFPDSKIQTTWTMQSDSPAGPVGSVQVVDFTLCGQDFQAMNAGELDPFTHAISFVVNCEDQAEVDRYWEALRAGGEIEDCGWVKDKYGVSWQIVPTVLNEMMADKDKAKAKRVTEAMLGMKKLDIAGLKAAYEGKPEPAETRG